MKPVLVFLSGRHRTVPDWLFKKSETPVTVSSPDYASHSQRQMDTNDWVVI